MTTISGETLEAKHQDIVTPFTKRTVVRGRSAGVSLAGYDICIAENVWLFPFRRFALASSVEKFLMPTNVVGEVKDKSTWVRSGLQVFNTVIEPGWKGHLTIELAYWGWVPLRIRRGDPIAQIVFRYLDRDTAGYSGKYNNQPPLPVKALYE